MKAVEVVPPAREELSAAIEWYEAQSPGLGLEFLTFVDDAFEAIAHAPAGYPVWDNDERVRRFVLDKFPYAIFYRERPHLIEVIAIAHTARKPGYWIERA